MSSSDLNPWWEASEPHQDVRSGDLPEDVFAIDLGNVLNENAPSVYQNPVDFFVKTHVTQVIEDLLQSVIENTGGHPSGNRIQRLQTGFGGGKTHILLTIYHLLNSPEQATAIDKIQQIVDASAVQEVPDVEIAVLVGTDVGTQAIRTVEDTQIRTLWGELAYQLGGMEAYDRVSSDDQERTAPGKDTIATILQEYGPSVILIDELLQYVSKARGVEVGKTTLGDQTVSFIDEFVRAVGTVEDAYSVVSLQASERYEMYADPEVDEQLLSQIESKVERVDAVTRPIQKSEIYNIARQRIFESVADVDTRESVARTYYEYYGDNNSDFPDRTTEPDYRDQLIDSYPFHPELIKTLYEQWASLPDFQRTRGVLRFLAKVVSNQYEARTDASLIQLGHVDMADEAVRDEALDYLEEGWDAVIGSDVAGPEAKATQIDRQLGGVYNTYRVTQSVAASLFMYSHGGGQQTDASLEKLRLAVLQPGMDTPLIADAINRCEDTFFYLHERDNFYRLRKQANLNQVISDYESDVDQEAKREAVRNAMPDVIGDSCFETHTWPGEPGDVPDDHTPRLAILPPEKPMDSGATDTMAHVREMWENHKDEFREFRNSILFIAPDAPDVPDLYQAATTKLALREIKQNQTLLSDLTDDQVDSLDQRARSANQNLPATIRDGYSEAAVPKDSGLKRISFTATILSEDDGIDELLEADMVDKDLLLSRLDPNLIASDHWDIWPTQTDDNGNEQKAPHITTQQLWDHFGKLAQLPLLKSENVLKECIARGVDEEAVFGYARYTDDGYEDLRFQETCNAGDIVIADDTVVIREAEALGLEQQEEPEAASQLGGDQAGRERGTASGGLVEGGIEGLGEGGEGIEPSEDEPKTATGGVASLEIAATPNWEDQWDDAYDAIIDPLARLGADITLEINVAASSEDGLSKTEIERQVEENLTQRNIEFTITYEDE